jgi:glycosyltransferase involved in cell wall biosynthesis
MIVDNKETSCHAIHLPDYHKSNPYQDLLLSNLSRMGIHAEYGKRKIYYSNIDVSLLYNVLKNKNFDVLHLHWQHPFMLHKKKQLMIFRSLLFVFQLLMLKFLKIKIVWTVHNLKNHENKYVKAELFFSRILARLADGIIVHCNASKNEIVKIFKINEHKIHVIEHGNYIGVYKERYTRDQSRKIMNIAESQFVFLFIGLVRPYKGINELIESFKKIKDASVKLIIAGRIEDKALAELLKDKASDCQNILFELHYIEDDEMEIYLKAADVLVLPYRDIINSGSAVLGMSFGKAIISPRMGCLPEILQSKGGILYDPDLENGLIEAMRKVLASKNNISDMGKENLETAKKWGWQGVAASTANVYHSCLGTYFKTTTE